MSQKNKKKNCLICGDEFMHSTSFMAVCNSCFQEQDNQTLEAILSLPENFLKNSGPPHQTDCSLWSGEACDCEGDVLDPAALSFHEAVNN